MANHSDRLARFKEQTDEGHSLRLVRRLVGIGNAPRQHKAVVARVGDIANGKRLVGTTLVEVIESLGRDPGSRSSQVPRRADIQTSRAPTCRDASAFLTGNLRYNI